MSEFWCCVGHNAWSVLLPVQSAYSRHGQLCVLPYCIEIVQHCHSAPRNISPADDVRLTVTWLTFNVCISPVPVNCISLPVPTTDGVFCNGKHKLSEWCVMQCFIFEAINVILYVFDFTICSVCTKLVLKLSRVWTFDIIMDICLLLVMTMYCLPHTWQCVVIVFFQQL